jgi:hypothetical protein
MTVFVRIQKYNLMVGCIQKNKKVKNNYFAECSLKIVVDCIQKNKTVTGHIQIGTQIETHIQKNKTVIGHIQMIDMMAHYKSAVNHSFETIDYIQKNKTVRAHYS